MPKLIQFGDLTPAHFAEHPVWAACHSFDFDEPWYDETDEETFRPWTGRLPVSPSDGLYLVGADFLLADGARLQGCLTPADGSKAAPSAFGTMQPQVFLPSGELVGFWLGMFGNPADAAAALYSALGKDAGALFPIRFSVSGKWATGVTAGELRGFYTIPDGSTVAVAR